MEQIALVLGATGGIGGAVARQLVQNGWTVRALVRAQSAARLSGHVMPVAGDAMDGAAVAAAARGARLIVHAVNPPGYRQWDKLVLPMLDNTIAAARTQGAQVLLPGTVYNYGPDSFPLIGEAAPQNPRTRKGAIRVAMEQRLRNAAKAGDIRALIVRAGDFFGPGAANNWFAQGLIKPGKRPAVIHNPGRSGIGHQWAYLPDVAETMVRLLARETTQDFETFHMDGHWDATGTAMVEAVVRALGEPAVRVASLPWRLLKIASFFAVTPRELMEMRYLWQQPVRLDNSRLIAALGAEPHTALDHAVHTTLATMGCLA